MTRRFAISTRVAKCDFGEVRDCLAEDWIPFMKTLSPGSPWLPMPNCGEDAARIIAGFGVDAIILSGGNDVGACRERDATEKAMVEAAIAKRLPVLGVCRGMQYLCHFFGGRIGEVDATAHAGRRHQVATEGDGPAILGWTGSREVNSYHRCGMRKELLPECLRAIAIGSDGVVEAFAHRELPFIGIQWHPERQTPYDGEDLFMARRLFSLSET